MISIVFYYYMIIILVSSARTVDGKLSPEMLHLKGNHTAIFQPRSYTNIFHFLEGSSQLIRLALHPHLFPSVYLLFNLFDIRFHIL